MAIKLSERESLLKSFALFFGVIMLFLTFIFYNYYKQEEKHLSEQLFLEMKNYSFFFEDERFEVDFISKDGELAPYELYFDSQSLYILIPMTEDRNLYMKIFYPLKSYDALLKKIQTSMLLQYAIFSFVAVIISFLFSLYALNPLRSSIEIMEEFIRDIIHDLNTPLTSIFINLKMMDKSDSEVQSIAKSAKTISMLHKNLDLYLKDMQFEKEKFSLKEALYEQVDFFASMYDYLNWEIEIEDSVLHMDKNAFSRIIYNLLSNACKYNVTDGFVKVKSANGVISISNSSYGIKNPSKIFERFYKEGSRGVGIGLHIVEKLSVALGIKKRLELDGSDVTISLELPKEH